MHHLHIKNEDQLLALILAIIFITDQLSYFIPPQIICFYWHMDWKLLHR